MVVVLELPWYGGRIFVRDGSRIAVMMMIEV